jgi:hypothetical protein
MGNVFYKYKYEKVSYIYRKSLFRMFIIIIIHSVFLPLGGI